MHGVDESPAAAVLAIPLPPPVSPRAIRRRMPAPIAPPPALAVPCTTLPVPNTDWCCTSPLLSIELGRPEEPTQLVWLIGLDPDGRIEVVDARGRTLRMSCTCVYVARMLMRLAPVVRTCIAFFGEEVCHVAHLFLHVDTRAARASLLASTEEQWEFALSSLVHVFARQCRFHVPLAAHIGRVHTGPAAAAMAWLDAVDASGLVHALDAVPIADTEWAVSVVDGTLQLAKHSRITALKPRGFVLQAPPTTAERAWVVAQLVATDAAACPYVCDQTWSVVVPSTSLVVCMAVERAAWASALAVSARVYECTTLHALQTLSMRLLAEVDVVLVTHEALGEQYMGWVDRHADEQGLTSLHGAGRASVRRLRARNEPFAHATLTVHSCLWRRVVVDDFALSPAATWLGALRARVTYGLCDDLHAVSADVLHRFVFGGAPYDAHEFHLSVHTGWSSAHADAPRVELVPETPTLRSGDGLVVCTVRRRQRARLRRELTSCSPAFAEQQTALYGRAQCHVCFDTSNCMTPCGHLLCAACVRQIGRSAPFACPTCRAGTSRVLTTLEPVGAREHALRAACQAAKAEGSSVLVAVGMPVLREVAEWVRRAKQAHVRVVAVEDLYKEPRGSYDVALLMQLPLRSTARTRALLRRAAAIATTCRIYCVQDSEEGARVERALAWQ